MRKTPSRRLMLCWRQAFINRMGDCDQVHGAQGWGFVKAVSHGLTIISTGVQSEDANSLYPGLEEESAWAKVQFSEG